jgi:hypothetical protein
VVAAHYHGAWLVVSGRRYRRGRYGLLIADRPHTLRGGTSGSNQVRNVLTEQALLCCHGPCTLPGNSKITIAVPHDAPRHPGEKLIYIFCSELCRRTFAVGSRFEHLL